MRSIPAFALAVLFAAPVLAGPPVRLAPQPQRVEPVPAIPEPAALALFVLGAGVVGVAIRRRKG